MTHARIYGEPQRRRLVRLCAAITRDRESAEDLAQETLLEAWRQAHKLHDPRGVDQWLAAIARNVCLRWARRQGRELPGPASPDAVSAVADDVDLEVELERTELAELLDRALALLPADAREVLVARYVHELPHAEIGERLAISDDAVSMRLSRGKVALRRLLASELADDAAAYGLTGLDDGLWRDTQIWCADCGRRRLHARREGDPAATAFRCPGCHPSGISAEARLANPTLARVIGNLVRPSAIHQRLTDWSSQYFLAGAETRTAACTRCRAAVRLRRYWRDAKGRPSHGVYAVCDACGERVSSSERGLAYGVDEVRALRRESPRTHVAAVREVAFDGMPALNVRYENRGGRSGVEVLLARDSLRLLHVTKA